MAKSKMDKKIEVRRTRNRLAGNLDKLENSKREYVEKAKTAYKKGDKHAYSLARSGLAATLNQQKRTREMLLNIDITSQMRDTGEITEEFLTGMETIFRRLIKINKSVDIKRAQKGLRNAISGMENVQAQLDGMLLESEDTFAELGSMGGVSEAELDGLLGIETTVEEELKMGAEIDTLIDSVNRENGVGEETRREQYNVAAASGTAEPDILAPVFEEEKPLAEPKKVALRTRAFGKSEIMPTALLDDYSDGSDARERNERALEEDAQKVEEVMAELGVPVSVVNKTVGPTFSRLEMTVPAGTSVQKIEPKLGDIAVRLGKYVRFESTIVGKNACGLEFANACREMIGLKEIVESPEFREAKGGVCCALGVDVERKPVIRDITRAPHLMVAGSTGSGKSCFLHSLIASIAYKYVPDEVRLALVDFKRVEMTVYRDSPYLVSDIADDDESAMELFKALRDEMERRYELLVSRGYRNAAEYNENEQRKLPYIIAIVDEYADISVSPLAKEFDSLIRQLSQKARASGINLILATQRPSVDVVSGTIKNNFPTQIAFKVSSRIDSRTVLAGQGGAETLLGKGDMLMNEASGDGLKRVQAPYISSAETKRIVDWLSARYGKGV